MTTYNLFIIIKYKEKNLKNNYNYFEKIHMG